MNQSLPSLLPGEHFRATVRRRGLPEEQVENLGMLKVTKLLWTSKRERGSSTEQGRGGERVCSRDLQRVPSGFQLSTDQHVRCEGSSVGKGLTHLLI